MKRFLYSLLIASCVAVLVGGGYMFVKNNEWKANRCSLYVSSGDSLPSACFRAFDPLQLALLPFIGTFVVSYILLGKKQNDKSNR